MKVIYIRNKDWAMKVLSGDKAVELLKYHTDYRGEVAIATDDNGKDMIIGSAELFATMSANRLNDYYWAMTGLPENVRERYKSRVAYLLRDGIECTPVEINRNDKKRFFEYNITLNY